MSKFMGRIQHDSRLHQCGWKLGLWMGWSGSWRNDRGKHWSQFWGRRCSACCRYWRNHRRRWRCLWWQRIK